MKATNHSGLYSVEWDSLGTMIQSAAPSTPVFGGASEDLDMLPLDPCRPEVQARQISALPTIYE